MTVLSYKALLSSLNSKKPLRLLCKNDKDVNFLLALITSYCL
ncbi:hypothetical protein [Campylobacter troglodytis]|nr:hypothetical protein [Campylobacter troglodytis]